MKKQLTIIVFMLSFLCADVFAAKDTLEISPNTNGLCCWTLTVKNRNAQSKAIDEIRFQITTADGTVFEDLKNVAQWSENILDVTASYVAEVSPIPVGGSKSDFGICLGVQKQDQPVNMKWVTYNSLSPIDSGTLQFICTPTQSYRNDSLSVVPSVISNDPVFTFTLHNKNDFALPISRFATQMVTVSGGTMRPSKISPPSGWKLDSVTNTFAYFSAESQSDYIFYNEVKAGFKVTLRGNPSINKFSFAWFTYDEGGALVSRDTLRNIPVTFTGFVPNSDSVKATLLNGCLYEMTVKNFHVSNQIPISKIRKVVMWRKTPGVSFSSAPSAPTFWTKTVKADSIIYTAPHDSLSIPSGVVNSLFRFNVDAPSSQFTLGWRTFRTLVDTLSSGEMLLQCQKEAPKSDTATLSEVGLCSYILKVYNEHNQPPSNLTAIKLSIPTGKGKLNVSFNTLSWDKVGENDTSVTFVVPSGGSSQASGQTQDFLFDIQPTTPGEQFPIRWATYDDAAVIAGTPLFIGQHTIGCSPPITKCDEVTRASVQAEECTYSYSFKNLRDTNMNRMLFEIGNGWTIFTAEAPTGWSTNIIGANKASVEFSIASALGIIKDSTLGGFIVKYVKQDTIGKLDTFDVTIKRYDAKEKECVDVIAHICTSTTQTSVVELDILEANVSVHPNPVSADATLTLVMETQSRPIITMLDVLGREVRVIENSILPEGEHQFKVSMKGLEEGSYYLRIQTPNGVITKKVVYMP